MATTFKAVCPKCDELRDLEEGMRERRKMKNGNIFVDREFYFRCPACGERHTAVRDGAGRLHKWRGTQHVAMDVPLES